jgi:hypothetical protein
MINLAKYLKGCTTLTELSEMPARYIHIIYKDYVDMLKDESKRKAHQSENAMDELSEAFGG